MESVGDGLNLAVMDAVGFEIGMLEHGLHGAPSTVYFAVIRAVSPVRAALEQTLPELKDD